MGMRIKFNLMLLLVMASLVGFYQWQQSKPARSDDGSQSMHLVLDIASNLRAFHQAEWLPELQAESFTPLQVPAYNTTEVLKNLPQGMSYRVVIRDAQIPRYQANLWQKRLLDQLQNEQQAELTGRLNDAKGAFTYLAKPILNNGQVVGAEVVTTTEPDATQSADSWLALLMVLVLIWVVANGLFQLFVMQPLQRVARQAEAISQGKGDAELPVNGNDALSQISQSFNRLHRSLKAAMNMMS